MAILNKNHIFCDCDSLNFRKVPHQCFDKFQPSVSMSSSAQTIPVKKGENATYRYQMSRLQLRSAQGRTDITNIESVAHDIFRTPTLLKVWFSNSMHVMAKFDVKTSILSLKGSHSQQELQTNLYEFIDHFVLCPSCTNPETVMYIKQDQLTVQCAACGQSSVLEGMQNKNLAKTATWIMKHLDECQTRKLTSAAPVNDLEDFNVPGYDDF